ncbi:MAG: response regulator [Mangrovibacterium sp.]
MNQADKFATLDSHHCDTYWRLFFFLFFFAQAGWAENTSSYKFRNIDVKKGLSDNYVQAITSDQYGFMWFGTNNGLNRFDGYNFKRYTPADGFINSNDVTEVKEDQTGTLWVLVNGHICFYDRNQDRLQHEIGGKLLELEIATDVNYLEVDDDKNLWCASADTLYYYNFKLQQLEKINLPDSHAGILQVVCKFRRAYVLFHDGQLNTVDWGTKNLVQLTTLQETHRNSRIMVDSKQNLWYYHLHSTGLWVYDSTANFWTDFSEKYQLQDLLITSVLDDLEGNRWIGSDNAGVFVFQVEEEKFTHLIDEPDNKFALPNKHISTLFRSPDGLMWVGSSKQGIAYAKMATQSMQHINLPTNQTDVTFIHEDSKENFIFGFDGEGIAFFDSRKQSYKTHRSKNAPENIATCSMINNDTIWIGTYGGGIIQFIDGKPSKWLLPEQSPYAREMLYVRKMVKDCYGNFWFASFMNDLYRYDGKSIVKFKLDEHVKEFNGISDLVYDGKDVLYVGTYNGLYRINIISNHADFVYENAFAENLLVENHISALFYDSHDRLWVGSRKGLFVICPQQNKLYQLTEDVGLSNNYIRAIAEDLNQDIWVTTDNGISQVEVMEVDGSTSFTCSPFYEEDGVEDLTFNNLSICISSNGELLMGSTSGILKLTPTQSLVLTDDSSKVVFTGLYIANELVEVGEDGASDQVILERNIQLVDEIELDYHDRSFMLEVSAMDYANIHKLRYYYRIDGEEWLAMSGNDINFNKLTPGKYTVEVKAQRGSSQQQLATAKLIVTVKPPILLSNVAILCYVVLIIFLLIWLARQYEKRHKEELEEQKQRMEITRLQELDKEKMTFFTNLSHDLKTPLSLIISPLEKMIPTKIEGAEKQELEMMFRNAKLLLNEVEQLLEVRKLDNAESLIRLAHGNLTEFIGEVCADFFSFAKSEGISLNIIEETKVIEMDFDQKKIRRVMQNLLANAFKYNIKDGKVEVRIGQLFHDQQNMARIEVADTGIGIADEHKEKIFDRFFQTNHTSTRMGSGIGLNVVLDYVKMHNGSVQVCDNKPQGTRIIVLLPISSQYRRTIKLEPTKMKVANQQEMMDENQKTVLVVEDNADFRIFLSNSLRNDYNILEAENGAVAMRVLEDYKVDLVLTDLTMPEMNGMELCEAMKADEKSKHIPIIMLSAQNAREQIVAGLNNGADDYLTKPFNVDILLIRVEKLMHWSRTAENKKKPYQVSPSDISVKSLDEELVQKAIEIVEREIAQVDFNVEQLSAEVGMSRGHLYRKLTAITGKTPVEFIRIIRIKRGMQLLQQEKGSVSEIAHSVGLSPKMFAKYFKEEFGKLPSEYN